MLEVLLSYFPMSYECVLSGLISFFSIMPFD